MTTENKRVWFICCTPYHLFNSVYYSNYLKGMIERNLIWVNNTEHNIDIKEFNNYFEHIYELQGYKNLLNNNSFIRKQCVKIKQFGWGFNKSDIARVIKEDSYDVIICFSDYDCITDKIIELVSRKKHYHIILIEEGLAIYMPDFHQTIINRVGNFICGIKSEPYIGHNRKINTLVVKRPNYLPEVQKQKRNILQQSDAFSDKIFEGLMDRIVHIEKKYTNCILWIGQPLDMIPYEEEKNILKKIIEKIQKEFPQKDIVIKPHPRDDVDKYKGLLNNNVHIFESEVSWIPIELFFDFIRPTHVFSPYSSACLSLINYKYPVAIIYCYKIFGLNYEYDLRNSGALDFDNVYDLDSIDKIDSSLIPISIEHCCVDSIEDLEFIKKITGYLS